jgi:hypothetical protein
VIESGKSHIKGIVVDARICCGRVAETGSLGEM